VKLRKLGIIFCGILTGFFISLLLNYLILWKIPSSPSNLFFQNISITFMILGGIIGYEV